LVIGISVAIGKEQGLEWWSGGKEYGLEYWSMGVLGLKAEIDLIGSPLPLVMRDQNMVYIFPLYQPLINPLLQYSITPILQHSSTPILQVQLTSSLDKERMTAVCQRR
jgi:hypothetical protein